MLGIALYSLSQSLDACLVVLVYTLLSHGAVIACQSPLLDYKASSI